MSDEVKVSPVAWLHEVVQDDGEADQALSFSPDSFPLQGVGGFRSLRARPLYTAAPSEILLAYENMIADHARLQQQLAAAREAIIGLLDYVDCETCTHEETHRGGHIWTICDSCGRKWADDEGGFVPHQDAPAVAIARATIDSTLQRDRQP